ncbi:Uncharacterized protein TCM_006488 [Theobroma cacao]|uniref:Uncharacterized protein n=1 Tax=Theobroma cacao TaxID=3641 RepID=A0A061DXF6_THECC|nr:Uncharacterized protein TCM_006488 [Theobroma cacao]
MASSPPNPKPLFHARSDSSPSRPHLFRSQLEEHLCRLRATDASSSSSSSICNQLSCLRDLYDSVDSFLQLGQTQRALAKEFSGKQFDKVLDGSLRRLDVSSITKDVLSRTKEQAQELQSIFRRRRGDECSFRNEVNVYLTSRKEAKNVTLKSLRDIKSKCRFSPADHENMGMVSMLREIDEVSLLVFESLLSYVSGANAQSKPSSWSSVSRFMHSKRIACNEEANDNNEFEKADSTLSTLIKTRKSSKSKPCQCPKCLGEIGVKHSGS